MEQVGPHGQRINIVHFTHKIGEEWRIACMPGMTELHSTPHHPHYPRSDDPRVANCLACQKSEAYRVVLDSYKRAKLA